MLSPRVSENVIALIFVPRSIYRWKQIGCPIIPLFVIGSATILDTSRIITRARKSVALQSSHPRRSRALNIRCRFACRQINCYPVYLLKRSVPRIDREHAARSIHRLFPSSPPPPPPRIITILRGERLLITRDYIRCILISVKRDE